MNNYLLHKIVHKIYIYIYDDDGNPGPDLGKTQKCMYIRHVPWIVTQESDPMTFLTLYVQQGLVYGV